MHFKKYTALNFLLLIIFFSLGLATCSSPPKLPPLANDAVIVAFGDSLTFGTDAEPAQSYPAVLEQMTGRKVINAGVPGEVTGDGLSRLPEVLEREKPALLILCHGGNDQLRRLNLKQSANNIREMIRLAQDRGVAVMLIAVPAPGLSVSPTPALSVSPPPLYRELAKEFSVPIEEKILLDVLADNTLKSDLIHPNDKGYRRIAESIAAVLKKSGAIN